MNKLFIMTHVSLEDQKLAIIFGELTLSAIDEEETDSMMKIRNGNCL